MFAFLILFKTTLKGKNATNYDIGSYKFSSEGTATFTFFKGTPYKRYQLAICPTSDFDDRTNCDFSNLTITGNMKHIMHLMQKAGTFFLRLTPPRDSEDEIEVVLKNGNLYNDMRSWYLNIEQGIIIIGILIFLIVYSKNMSGHFKKINLFAVIFSLTFVICQAMLLTNDLITNFTNTGFLFNWAVRGLNLISYLAVLINLAIYSGATTFSGLEFSWTRSICLIVDIVFLVLYFISIFAFPNSFLVECPLVILFSVGAILISAFLRWKTKRDYYKTFDMVLPTEISSISDKSLFSLICLFIVNDIIVLIDYCFEDFHYPKLLIATLVFSLMIVFLFMFTNTRLDLIVLTPLA